MGDVFTRLTVVSPAPKHPKYGRRRWYCCCSCGNNDLIIIDEAQLKSGKTRSCGCLQTETKRKLGKSNIQETFYDWCKKTGNEEYLELWSDTNDVKPEDVGIHSLKKYDFRCPNNNSHVIQLRLDNIYRNKNGFKCPICNSFGQKLIDEYGEDAVQEYWDFEKNEFDVFELAPNTNKPIWIKCVNNINHGSYKTAGNKFWGRGDRCPKCSNHIIIDDNSLGHDYPESIEAWSDKNTKTPFDYSSGSGAKVWWKCLKGQHDDYLRSINDQKKSFICPECFRIDGISSYQKRVEDFLRTLPYNLKHEYGCSICPINPRTGHLLPFDNEVVELKLIIEVNGAQHYGITGFAKIDPLHKHSSPKEAFEYQKWKDNYKREFAIAQGYHFLELPYWEIDNGSYREIITDKIKTIAS